MTDTISPRGIARLTASSATTWRLPSKCLETRSSSIMGCRANGNYVNHFTKLSEISQIQRLLAEICAADRRTGGLLDASGAPEPDGHRAGLVDNHGHGAAAVRVAEHPLQLGRLLLDVDVFERDVPPLMVCPGGFRVRSTILAEDLHHEMILPLDATHSR